ncbi:MAG: DNA-3-methyladenine glycosylase I [Actinobacteria bacterium]|nr:DNA-3-methyladenine glycosylase I [Actinomycetota bacterium]
MPGAEAPTQIKPTTLGDYFEVMSKADFQTGISWAVVESKWPGIRAALRGFEAEAVAALGPKDIDALVQDPRVIRNRAKLQAIVGNARRMLDLADEHGGFKRYLRAHGDFGATVAALRKASSSWARRAATTSCTSSVRRCRRMRSGWPRGASSAADAPGGPPAP